MWPPTRDGKSYTDLVNSLREVKKLEQDFWNIKDNQRKISNNLYTIADIRDHRWRFSVASEIISVASEIISVASEIISVASEIFSVTSVIFGVAFH
jgi:hypothetical protein